MKKLVIKLVGLIAFILPMRLKKSLYRTPLLAGLIRSGLNLAAPSGLTTVTVASGGLQGYKLALDLKIEKDYWLGTYEAELQAAIADFARPGSVAYDVGANIGYITLLLARWVTESGKVFAFEALPANQPRLAHNIHLNQLEQQVSIIPCAVIEASHTVRFLPGPSDGTGKAEGSAGRKELEYSDPIEVKGVSLDDFVYTAGNPPPQLIKLDIEGGEILALPGMLRLLKEARPIFLLELHGPEASQAAWDVFQSCDYRICYLKPGYPAVPSLTTLDWKSYLVALPNSSSTSDAVETNLTPMPNEAKQA